MGNRNEEMEMKKWRNGGNKSEPAWRMTLSSLWRYGRRSRQSRLHQPENKTGTCNISSNVASLVRRPFPLPLHKKKLGLRK